MLSDSDYVFANPKSDGFLDSFRFRFSFPFGKPVFIGDRNPLLPLAIEK